MPTLTVTLPAGDLAKRIADLEARVAALEPVIYTVTDLWTDSNHPGFFFVVVQKPISEAQNDSTIAFSYDPNIVYTVDSVTANGDSSQYKVVLPEGVNIGNYHFNIVGSTIITT